MTHRLPLGLLAAAGLVTAGLPAAAQTLRVGLVGDLRTPIVAGSTDESTMTVQQHVYEGLVTWKENGEVAPMLAVELPEVSDDGLTYTFTLRDGLTFQDGTPLTAQSVVDSWNYLLEETNGWTCRQYFNGTGSVTVESIEALDERQVAFTLAEPAPEILTQMSRADCGETGIMAPAVYTTENQMTPIGTGPYKVDEILPQKVITLSRFEDYQARSEPADGYAGNKAALLDTIKFVIIPDPAATFAAIMADEIDIWPQISTAYYNQMIANPDLSVESVPIPSINTLPFNTAEGPLADPAVRKAANHAIDREAMVQVLAEGFATPSASPVPTSTYFGELQKSGFEHDVEKARALLEEAGYDGEPVIITANKNYNVHYDTAVMVQAFLQQAGINAELEIVDFGTQLPKYYSGDYHTMTWNYSPTLDPALILDRIAGDKTKNPSRIWTNPEARELVDSLLRSPGAGKQEIYDKIHTLFLEDSPLMIWSGAANTSAFHDRVEGYAPWAGRKPRFWGVTVAE